MSILRRARLWSMALQSGGSARTPQGAAAADLAEVKERGVLPVPRMRRTPTRRRLVVKYFREAAPEILQKARPE
jgi:hypothetical protein